MCDRQPTVGRNNAMRFETSKTKAILFSRRRRHRHCQRGTRVGDQTVRFAWDVTCWLGIWRDSTLTLAENRRRKIGKARQAEARLRQIISTYWVPPAAARNLQMAIAQGAMLYAAELTWRGGIGVESEYKRATNRTSRATLGVFQSTPFEIATAESGLIPARELLNHRPPRVEGHKPSVSSM